MQLSFFKKKNLEAVADMKGCQRFKSDHVSLSLKSLSYKLSVLLAY